MTETPELKPCPFCGSEDVHADKNTEETFLMQCESCFSEGPEADSVPNALEKWNRRVSPWQPIETAPKNGQIIDIWCRVPEIHGESYDRIADCWYSAGRWWGYDENGNDICRLKMNSVTHWMPLPEPPEVEK